MAILNISLVTLTFSDARELNLTAEDLDQNMLDYDYDVDASGYKRASLDIVRWNNFFRVITLNVNVLKTSVKLPAYLRAVKTDSNLDGTLTVTLDNGSSFVVKSLIVSDGKYGVGDESISTPIKIVGVVDTNIEALV